MFTENSGNYKQTLTDMMGTGKQEKKQKMKNVIFIQNIF